MRILFQLSWRNIWRHPARSGVLLAAIGAGLWGGLMISALGEGFIEARFARLIENEVSHIQVHHPEYRTEREAGMYVDDAGAIMQWLAEEPSVRSYTARTLSDGMIQSPLTTAGVQIRGVLPESERRTTALHESLVEGDYLETDARNPVVLGRRLAGKLNVGIGNRVVLTFQDLDNELTSAAFTIVGIYQIGSAAYEERHVFVKAEDLYTALAARPVFHEVAVLLEDAGDSAALSAGINERFTSAQAQTWFELSPELRYIADAGNQFTYIIMVVILLALAFGILNTMLMAIFERMRELGMLMAVGMNRPRVFTMILLETVMLSLLGAAAGMGVSVVTISWLQRNGLDLSAFSEGLAAFGYDAVVHPSLGAESFVGITLMVIVTAILASIYPAVKALRLKPAVAVRE